MEKYLQIYEHMNEETDYFWHKTSSKEVTFLFFQQQLKLGYSAPNKKSSPSPEFITNFANSLI